MSGPIALGGAGASNVRGWQVVERKLVAASTQTLDFDYVLGASNEIAYRITARLKNAFAGTTIYVARYKTTGAFAAIAYSDQHVRWGGAASAYVRSTAIGMAFYLTSAGTADEGDLYAELSNPGGSQDRLFRRSEAQGGIGLPDIKFANTLITTPAASATITGLGWGCDRATGIGAGSIFMLEIKRY